MNRLLQNITNFSFPMLSLLLPLVFFHKTSELFEFNKISLLYIFSGIVFINFIAKCLSNKKINIKLNLETKALIVFLASQVVSTYFSIDKTTSIFGYYSRWNGGLLSLLAFASLYLVYSSEATKKTNKLVFGSLILSGLIASIWGIFEHFGHSPSCFLITGSFDVSCWVQDVAHRVFATFGQPNWMAAYIAAIIPLLYTTVKSNKKLYLFGITIFGALIFTKSRSGIIAFAFADFVFLAVLLIKLKQKDLTRKFFVLHALFLIIVGLFGTPWSPSILEKINKSPNAKTTQTGTSLETGGTESGEIRKIVWAGAINVWRAHPIVGTGVETFAYSYYQGRPLSHNYTSEWNFIYNKAHNEYLNFLATTGILGLISYLFLIFSFLWKMWKRALLDKSAIGLSLLAGFSSILVTNFFGFSVVSTSLLFFMLPALSTIESTKTLEKKKTNKILPKYSLIAACAAIGILFYLVGRVWFADLSYSSAQKSRNLGDFEGSVYSFQNAISLNPLEPLYYAELSDLYADVAIKLDLAKDSETVKLFEDEAVGLINESQRRSNSNIKILKINATTLQTLGEIDKKYFEGALTLIEKIRVLAPTDPSVDKERALILVKLGKNSEALASVESAIAKKGNYKQALQLRAYLLEKSGKKKEALDDLNFILKEISPDDELIKKDIQRLQSGKDGQ